MGVPSLQEDNQIPASSSSSPKQPTSELKHETNYKDIRCVSVDQNNDTSKNIGTETVETTTVLASVSYSVEISSAETNSNSEETGQPVDDVSRNQGLGQLEAIHEDVATNINPEEPAPPPDDVSNSQVLELWQPIQENTNSSPKESGPPPDDVSKIDGCGQLEPMQEDATRPASQSGHGQKGEDGPTNSDPKESGPHLNDVSRNLGLGQSEPMEEDGTQCTTNSNPEELRGPPNDVSKNGGLEELVSMEEDATCNSSQLGYEEKGEDEARNSSCKVSGPPLEDVSKNQGVGEKGEDTARNSDPEELSPLLGDLSNSIGQFDAMQEEKKIEDVATDSNPRGSGPSPDDVSKNQDPTDEARHGEKGDDVATNSNTEELGSPNGEKGANVKPRKGKNKSTPFGSTRVLRSRSEEKSKAPEPSTNVAEDLTNKENKRKKKKKKQMKNVEKVNEFSRIRKHLRYLLTRMNYEQNLIDAYSGEGWKGQSLEKIKPEKELQRAKSEIFRCKLKIRDLFQRLHISCAEGRLPEDLFDSEGEIDSEDIFCAKCGSKELPANNDIILCDGACERGFHQFCLDPPLLNEDIPPDDEGWLCPGCDCKVDCIELLNDAQGTNLSITDSWEEVFPEAAAAASGTNMAYISGLPSDDSEDDDYDPEGPPLDKEMQDTESSSGESDFSSASEDLGALPITDQYAGLLSDDSEDDDYNPNSQDPDEKDKQESLSSDSDFTSDSEYFSAGSDHNGERPEVGGTRRQILSDELLSLLDPGPGVGYSAPLSEKRHVERLDYKRLHDEAYGNASSDSSDEDYTDAPARKRRKTNNGKVASVLPKRNTPNKDSKQNLKESEQTPKRRTSKKLDDEATGDSPAKSSKGSSGPDSSGKSTNRKLGEAATQRLLESFKENKYPDRMAKENLAKELSLAVKQISKWFENARWSFNHSLRMDSKLAESASRNGTRDHVEKSAAARNSRPTKSRQSNVKSDNKNTEAVSSTVEMTHKQNADDNTPKAQEVRRSGRVRSKRTNSGS